MSLLYPVNSFYVCVCLIIVGHWVQEVSIQACRSLTKALTRLMVHQMLQEEPQIGLSHKQ